MFFFDYSLMMLGLLSFISQVATLLIALVCGCKSLLALRQVSDVKSGQLHALICVSLSVLVEVWIVLFFTPWRFPASGWLLFLPLPTFQIGLCSVVLWISVRNQLLPRIVRLAVALAVLSLVTVEASELQRWNRRRDLLHQAGLYDVESRSFMDSYERHASRRAPSDEFYANHALRYAKHRAALARSCRWAADHPGQPVPIVPPAE